MRAEVKRGAAGRDNNATAALRHRHLPSADLVRAAAFEWGRASREGVKVGETDRESRVVLSVDDSDVAKGDASSPAMEFGVPSTKIQPRAAEKPAKPRGKLIRIARVEDLESLQREPRLSRARHHGQFTITPVFGGPPQRMRGLNPLSAPNM
jgi:hypothetical protein